MFLIILDIVLTWAGWLMLTIGAFCESPYIMAFGAVAILSSELSDISKKLEKIND